MRNELFGNVFGNHAPCGVKAGGHLVSVQLSECAARCRMNFAAATRREGAWKHISPRV